MVTYKEFRDFIKSEVKKNNIKLPSIKKWLQFEIKIWIDY
jgi:hypothetical protein